MRIRTVLASAATLALLAAACSGPAKKPARPEDDVPQEITCCFDDNTEGSGRQTMSVESCPEEDRHPVDQCDIGPGDAEPTM